MQSSSPISLIDDDDDHPAQEEEQQVLKAIYQQEYTLNKNSNNNTTSFTIKLQVQDTQASSSVAAAASSRWIISYTLDSSYPFVSPPSFTLSSSSSSSSSNSYVLTPDDTIQIQSLCFDVWQQHRPQVCCYAQIECIRNYLQSKQNRKTQEEQDRQAAQLIHDLEAQQEQQEVKEEEDELQEQRAVQPKEEKERSSNHSNSSISSSSVFVPTLVSGPPLTDRKSTFQAHLCPVTNMQQLRAVILHVHSHSRLSKATHNILAYRIIRQPTQQSSSFFPVLDQDCEDDGEHKAGGRLLKLLQQMQVENVVVIVSRWYGGIMLGTTNRAVQ